MSLKTKIKLKKKNNTEEAIAEHTLDQVPHFDTLIHISDIHIRPLRRHEEFQAVFQETLAKIRARTEAIAVVITGDLFDNKTTFHPETFKLARDFLKALAGLAPVFLIAGNHDMYENNLNRLDAITPVADDIAGLYYLKYSGLYYVSRADICFVVSSLYDKQFIRKADVTPADNAGRPWKYIALYHGAITGTTTDVGYEVPESPVEDDGGSTGSTRYRSVADFAGFDAVLLGDIHKHQIRQVPEGGLMAYAGSLIQQNHGEPLSGHGMLIWDAGLKCTFEPVLNPWGFIDIHCENGLWTNADIYYIPPKCYARLIIRNCTEEQVNVITATVKTRCETLLVEKRQCLSNNLKEIEVAPTVQRLGDENELITEMATGLNCLPAEIQTVLGLHARYQAELDQSTVQMNTAVWKPLHLEFKNLFGYGGDTVNRIDFSPGVTCISAANARGKTSFVNIILFGIFGKTPLNPSGSSYTFDVVNTGCEAGYVKMLLTYGGEYYLIERKSVKKKGKSAAVSLNRLNSYEFTCGFWRSNAAGEAVENLQDTRKKNTDTALTELFGDITDFSLANLLNKESAVDLLAMTPAEQIRTLKRLFKLEIYDGYREVNRKYQTEIEAEIARSMLEKQHYEAQLTSLPPVDLDAIRAEYAECVDVNAAMRENADALRQEKADMLEQIKAVDHRITPGSPAGGTYDDKTLAKEMKKFSKSIPTGSSCAELDFKIATLRTAVQSLPHIEPDERAALESEAAGLPTVDRLAGFSPAAFARIKEKIAVMEERGVLSTDPFPESTIEGLKARIQELRQEKVSLSSNVNRIQEKLDALNLDDLEDTEESPEHLHGWLKENAAVISGLTQKIDLITVKQEGLNRVRSKSTVGQTREALVAQLVDLPYTRLRDVTPMAALRKKILALTDRLNSGERGRVADMMAVLKAGGSLSLTVRQNLLAYLEEKYTGVYDTSITASLNEVKALEKEYQNFVLLQETNAQVSQNTALQADIAELDYQQGLDQLRTCRAEREGAELNRVILEAKLENVKVNQCHTELTREREAHARNAGVERQLAELYAAIDYKTLHALYPERDRLRAQEIQTVLAQFAQGEAMREELYGLDQQCAQQRLYETYVGLCLERYTRDRQALCQCLTGIEADLAAQVAALTENEARVAELNLALGLAEYKQAEYEAVKQKFAGVTETIITAQKALAPYEIYAKIMSNRGIACRLLYLKIKAIEGYINRIIQTFTKYTVHILYDDGKQTINIITENRETAEHLSIQRLSGYEKLMLQVAFKRALNKFSYNSKSSLIIIDEALDCIDSENFQTKLPEVMSMIAQDYAVAIAISQRDISHISDRAIQIRVVNGWSTLWGGGSAAPRP